MSIPSAADWDRERQLLTTLYVHENKTVKDVLHHMFEHRRFKATERMYEIRFSKWRLDKKIKDREARAIVRVVRQRATAGKQGPHFRLRGRVITLEEAKRSLGRKKREISERSSVSACSTPSDLSVLSEVEDATEVSEGQEGHRELVFAAFNQEQPSRPPNTPVEVRHNVFILMGLQNWYTTLPKLWVNRFEAGDACECCTPIRKSPNASILCCRDDVLYEALGKMFAALSMFGRSDGGEEAAWSMLRAVGPDIALIFDGAGLWLIPRLANLADFLERCCRIKPYDAREQSIRMEATLAIKSFISNAARENCGEHHPLSALSMCLFLPGARDLIVQMLQQNLAVVEKRDGKGSGRYVHSAIELARHYQDTGKAAEGKSILSNLLRENKLIHGPTAWQVRDVMYMLGVLYYEADDLQNAEKTFLQVIQDTPRGLEHQLPEWSYIYATEFLSMIYEEQLKWERCEYWSFKAISYMDVSFGREDIRTLAACHRLDLSLRMQGKESDW